MEGALTDAPERATAVCWAALALAVSILGCVPAARAAAPGWPRDIPTPEGVIRVYEPHVDSLAGDTLESRAAISIVPIGGNAEPTFGAIWLTAKVATDPSSRIATFPRVVVTRVHLPDASADDEKRVAAVIEAAIPKWSSSIPLDVLASAAASAAEEQRAAAALRTDPPRILVSKVPAVLMLIDGEPLLRPIEGTALEQVVNTDFAVIHDPATQSYYTTNGDLWYQANDVKGPWSGGIEPPAPVASAVAEARRQAEAVQGAAGPANQTQGSVEVRPASAEPSPSAPRLIPEILVSTDPAELLAFDGEPDWAPVTGTGLLTATNTESDVFLDIGSRHIFVLLSGRWFTSTSLDGSWSFVAADALPADFARIPREGPKSHVRANVAGTPEAQDAVIAAQTPQTAAIDRHAAHLDVVYDGPPRFERIPGTEVEYAVNTSSQVLRIGGRFFAVDQGVWFVSENAVGPWEVSDERPPEVDAIPPSYPVYNARYVYVYDSTPDYVYEGYLPGYVGCYPWGATVVFGTGYYYRPCYGRQFFARPCTWGFGVRYHPWWGWSYAYDPRARFLRVGWYAAPCPPSAIRIHTGWYGPAGALPVYEAPPIHTVAPPTYVPAPAGKSRLPPVTTAKSGPYGDLYHRPQNVTRIAAEPRSYTPTASAGAGPSQHWPHHDERLDGAVGMHSDSQPGAWHPRPNPWLAQPSEPPEVPHSVMEPPHTFRAPAAPAPAPDVWSPNRSWSRPEVSPRSPEPVEPHRGYTIDAAPERRQAPQEAPQQMPREAPRYAPRYEAPAPSPEPRFQPRAEPRAEPRYEPAPEPRFQPRREARPEPRYEPPPRSAPRYEAPRAPQPERRPPQVERAPSAPPSGGAHSPAAAPSQEDDRRRHQ